MSEFFTNLFTSIFTPGPTPTLVVATNASFAALQLVLLGLVIATYSIHFVILSFLSGGLWWAINWFVMELEASKQKEREESQGKKERSTGQQKRTKHEPPDESGTETEEVVPAIKKEDVDEGIRLRVKPGDERLSNRASSSFGDISGTDSEWDKVSENEGNEP
ncbi:SMK killer toxin resistance protein [Thelotrema lepadinum]|nr:SMK killer toxin resistance protein [Thelotrema lepadinum]